MILGDLFEAWFGPKTLRLDGAATIIQTLTKLIKHKTQLHIIPNNQNFLLGRDFEG